jgi:arylsulfatase A-like enzyme
MLRSQGYSCSYQGKWHLTNAYVDPTNPVSTADALEPYGFSEFNDWGDIDGGAWAGLRVDPVIAGQAVKWLRDRAPVVAQDRPCVTSDDHWRAGTQLLPELPARRGPEHRRGARRARGVGAGRRHRGVFTADHGEMAGSHRLRQKGNLFAT